MLRTIPTLAALMILGQQAIAQQDPPTLTIEVPVQISDLTQDVYGINLVCDALASDGNYVASGRTYFIESSIYSQYTSELSQLSGSDDSGNIVPGELSSLENGETLQVFVQQNQGYQIDGWVTGRCDLLIMHGTPSHADVILTSSAKYCDSAPGIDVEISTCAWPGSELVTVVTFVRPGFNEDGSLAALPGVDD